MSLETVTLILTITLVVLALLIILWVSTAIKKVSDIEERLKQAIEYLMKR